MAEQPKHNVAIDEIKSLEDRRYRAMTAGDAAVLDELCSDDLIYDDKRSYIERRTATSFAARKESADARSRCAVAAATLGHKGQDTRALRAYLGPGNITHTVRYTELSPTRFKDFWRE